MHFFIAYFLGEISKYWNLLFLIQNLANSIILPPKNGGLKAWSHGVRKANFKLFLSLCLGLLDTKCFQGGSFLSWETEVFNFSIKIILQWSSSPFCRQNLEGHIFEEKIHCTASKVDEICLKWGGGGGGCEIKWFMFP